MGANVVDYWKCQPGQKAAVLQAGTAGLISISEMAKVKPLSEFELKAAADNAALKGADAVEEHLPPIPCTRDAVYARLDRALRGQGRALVAMQLPQANVLDAPPRLHEA